MDDGSGGKYAVHDKLAFSANAMHLIPSSLSAFARLLHIAVQSLFLLLAVSDLNERFLFYMVACLLCLFFLFYMFAKSLPRGTKTAV